jgi:hypothetical protein
MPELSFPSGPWTGFYNYGAGVKRHRMDISLTFENGRISGDGVDDVGRFAIAGHYDTSNGECHWTKTYIGAHDVFYRGFREGKGIWGIWDLRIMSGGFHIWPVGEVEDENWAETFEEPLLLEPVGSSATKRLSAGHHPA